jgi:cytochrome P450
MANYDPHSYELHEKPYATYEELRKTCPVYHNERLDCWALFRFKDVQDASRDWQAFTTAEGTFLKTEIDAVRQFFPAEGKFLDMDPPRHTELRGLLKTIFSTGEIKKKELEIRAIAVDLINAFAGRGKADLATEFVAPLPVRVISGMLGVPQSDEAMVSQWSHDMHVRAPDGQVPPFAMEAGYHMRDYFQAMIDERRRLPRADLVHDLVVSTIEGVPLTDNEILGMSILLYVAGNETTRMLITTALRLLEQNPTERDRLARDFSAIPAAIEEILRFDSPVSNEARTTTRDLEINGCPIPKGKQVLLVYGSANRDESNFEAADQLNLSRPPKRHLAFGEGIHQCIGASLARLEARIALEEILTRMPNYKVVGPVLWEHSTVLRGPISLPVEF